MSSLAVNIASIKSCVCVGNISGFLSDYSSWPVLQMSSLAFAVVDVCCVQLQDSELKHRECRIFGSMGREKGETAKFGNIWELDEKTPCSNNAD